jgi:RimJ/RimL family protein N-acetyltransferase
MSSYPKTFSLKDSNEIFVREMQPDDLEKSFNFFQKLPQEDKLFLRVDVAKKEVVERRMKQEGCDREVCYRLVAEKGDEIVGDATLCIPAHGWSVHTAVIRFVVARDFRNQGLASILVRELFVAAVKRGIEKIEVEVIEDNLAGLKSVQKLGFRQEGVLREFVKDVRGRNHNLVTMSYFV